MSQCNFETRKTIASNLLGTNKYVVSKINDLDILRIFTKKAYAVSRNVHKFCNDVQTVF